MRTLLLWGYSWCPELPLIAVNNNQVSGSPSTKFRTSFVCYFHTPRCFCSLWTFLSEEVLKVLLGGGLYLDQTRCSQLLQICFLFLHVLLWTQKWSRLFTVRTRSALIGQLQSPEWNLTRNTHHYSASQFVQRAVSCQPELFLNFKTLFFHQQPHIQTSLNVV